MTLKEFYDIILKRIQLIILITVAGAIIAGVCSFVFIKAEYESTSSFYVLVNPQNKEALAYNELQASQMLVNDTREFIKSRSVLDNVKTELAGMNIAVSGLASKVTVKSKSDTRIIEISVRDNDPDTAYAINASISEKLIDGARNIMKIDNIAVVDNPNLPITPVSPGRLFYTLLGAFLGCALAVFLVLAIDYLDTTIKTKEDVTAYLDLPVLGKIPSFDTRVKK